METICQFQMKVCFTQSNDLENSLFYVDLLNTNEQYMMTLPAIIINGVFFGTSEIQIGGNVIITGKDFKTKISIDSSSLSVKGNIKNSKDEVLYTVEGEVDGKVYIVKNKEKKVIYDASEVQYSLPKFKKFSELEENHSRKKWHHFASAVHQGDNDTAQVEKTKIEEKEREERKRREEVEEEWTPKHFIKSKDYFLPKNGKNRSLEVSHDKEKGFFSKWFS